MKPFRISRSLAIIATLLAASSHTALAADWGNFKGRLVLEGNATKPAVIKVDRDAQFCGNFGLVVESLVVNKKNGGVKNVVIYLYLSPTEKPPTVHPDYAKLPKQVNVVNKNCRFEPHIVTLTVEQTLVIGNGDKISHNSKLDVLQMENLSINPIIPVGQEHRYKYNVEERIPNPLSCSIHPWMTGYVLVRNTPYFAVTDEDGKFEIKNVPAGEWTFRLWQENVGYVQKVKVGGKSLTWRGGRVKVEIPAGATHDLGEVKSTFTPTKR